MVCSNVILVVTGFNNFSYSVGFSVWWSIVRVCCCAIIKSVLNDGFEVLKWDSVRGCWLEKDCFYIEVVFAEFFHVL